MSGLSEKDFKAAIIKRLHKGRAKTLEADRKIVSARDRRYGKKKNKMEIIELKNTITKVKKTPCIDSIAEWR